MNQKKKILNQAGISNYSSLVNSDIEDVCNKIFLDEIHKERSISKNSEFKGDKRR